MGNLFCTDNDVKEEEEEDEIPLLLPLLPRGTKIIGFAGKAGAGKDTAAAYLVERHGFQRMAFADVLKEAVSCLFGISLNHLNHPYTKELRTEAWGKSPRELMQWLGDVLRRDINNDFFVTALAQRVKSMGATRVVVSDVRFVREAEFIRAHGGKIIELSRNEQQLHMSGSARQHESERGLPDRLIDYKLANNSSRSALFQALENLYIA